LVPEQMLSWYPNSTLHCTSDFEIWGPGPPGWWSLRWDSKIWPLVLRDFELRVTALARPRSNCTVIYDPSSRQRGRYKITNLQLCKGYFKEKDKLVTGPRWESDTRTDWPTDCRL
jgi:hypothetical protein